MDLLRVCFCMTAAVTDSGLFVALGVDSMAIELNSKCIAIDETAHGSTDNDIVLVLHSRLPQPAW